MKCECGAKLHTIETAPDGDTVHRVRQCVKCGLRFVTTEKRGPTTTKSYLRAVYRVTRKEGS